jgi:hypothetical protein
MSNARIAEAPLAVANARAAGPVASAKAFIAAAQSAAADGLTWQEFGTLMVALLHLLVEQCDAISSMTGDEKKALVLSAVADLFDSLADKCVPLPLYPFYVLARPAIRSLVLALAGGAIEQLLHIVRSA